MKKSMLTCETLDRFEREYKTEHYTPEQVKTIEHAAYVANMNRCGHPEWTEADIFADFIRVLGIHKIETEPTEADETEQEENEMKNAQFIAALTAQLEAVKNRSAWDRGVQQYAESLADDLAEYLGGGWITLDNLRTWDGAQSAMLNGADGWTSYSYGGSALIYDYEIAERLCNPSELKKTRGGERNPNSRETWLDCQARALRQASRRVYAAIRQAFEIIEEAH